MINPTYKPLMFPEPEATGSPAPTEQQQNAPAPGGVYDIPETVPESAPETPTAQTETAPENAEYHLTLEGLDEQDAPYASIMTQAAKDAGLPADAASKFIMDFTKQVNALAEQEAQEDDTALRKEWGRHFENKFNQTRSFMAQKFNQAGLTENERKIFASPTGFRIWNKLMGTMSEKPAIMNQPVEPAKSRQESINDYVDKMVTARASNDFAKTREYAKKINELAGATLFRA